MRSSNCARLRVCRDAPAVLAARATLRATLDAYLGKRSAERVLAAPLRRDLGETIQAALLYADCAFHDLSETTPPAAVIAALDAWFDRIAGAVHAFGGEVLKFIGDGVLAIFPVVEASPRRACDAALARRRRGRAGMAHLNDERRNQGLPPLSFGAALHLGEMLWGNIGAANRSISRRSVPPSISPAGSRDCASRFARPCWYRARSPPRRTCLSSRSDRIRCAALLRHARSFALPET
jgi:class 3 adenylate cyclase